jgi:hypothetical protein
MNHPQLSWKRMWGMVVCLSGIILVAFTQALACDVAVVSGRVTTDGRPVIWKNFDNSSSANQQVKFFSGRKSGPGGYIMVYRHEDGMRLLTGSAITPSAGVNESGFAIACTSVYQDYNIMAEPFNLNTALMEEALATCFDLEDFERLLMIWPYSHLGTVISANFVVIDAYGGAAYYECFTGHLNTGLNLMRYRKSDANTGRIVDQNGWTLRSAQSNFIGFFMGTNFNTYIPWNAGQDRQVRGEYLLTQLASSGMIDYRSVMREVAKDVNGKQVNEWSETRYSTVYCISRAATRSGVVVRGVPSGQDARLTTMWCNLGEPSIGVFVPFFPAAKDTSYLAYMDTVSGGTYYDRDDSCLLNLAIRERETYGGRLYTSNEGDPIFGMYNNYINKAELAWVQSWTFAIEDMVIDQTELFLSLLGSDATRRLAGNFKSFSDYCVQYSYDNYTAASAQAVDWDYTWPWEVVDDETPPADDGGGSSFWDWLFWWR